MIFRSLFLLSLLFAMSGCSTIAYYSQSIHGQLSILFKRESIESVLQDKNTSDSLQQQLIRAQKIRAFASNALFLPDNKSYSQYVDLQRPYVVWNVFAAPEFSLSPKTWCYPIVGCVSYRGYFAEQDALVLAKELEQENLDVHVAGIAAYSTLGWFDDPLLNTMINWSEQRLAGLIFHELSHQLIYISDETAFNEAFASAVERLGTLQWLVESHPEQIPRYLDYLQVQADFRDLILDTRQNLNNIYDNPAMSDTQKRELKNEVISTLRMKYENVKTRWPANINYDGWFEKPINNARLTSAMTYLQKIPGFYSLFTESNGRWKEFYDRVLALEELPKAEREQIIERRSNERFSYEELLNLIRKNTTI